MGRGCIYEEEKGIQGHSPCPFTHVERQKMERFNNPEFTSDLVY